MQQYKAANVPETKTWQLRMNEKQLLHITFCYSPEMFKYNTNKTLVSA